jgi:hypothetical protein
MHSVRLKGQSIRLIIRFYLNRHKNVKHKKILKIFLDPLLMVPKASHTTFFWGANSKIFGLLSAC